MCWKKNKEKPLSAPEGPTLLHFPSVTHSQLKHWLMSTRQLDASKALFCFCLYKNKCNWNSFYFSCNEYMGMSYEYMPQLGNQCSRKMEIASTWQIVEVHAPSLRLITQHDGGKGHPEKVPLSRLPNPEFWPQYTRSQAGGQLKEFLNTPLGMKAILIFLFVCSSLTRRVSRTKLKGTDSAVEHVCL